MRKILSINILGALFSFTSVAQSAVTDTFPLNDAFRELFSRPIAISGIYLYNGFYYFASKRCNKIFAYNNSASMLDSIPINRINANKEVEGITAFKNKFLK